MKKYNCDPCDFHTHDLTKYTRHKSTKKHYNTHNAIVDNSDDDTETDSNTDTNTDTNKDDNVNGITCDFCKVPIKYKYHVKRHLMVCKAKKKHDADQIITKLTKKNDKVVEELESIKQKNDRLEQDMKQLQEEYYNSIKTTNQALIKANSRALNNTQQPQGNTTINGDVNVNINFVKNNFVDVSSYEEIMNMKPTPQEVKFILENDPVQGCYKLINDRCIKNVAVENRSLHCTDVSRNKFIIKTKTDWDVDEGGGKILQPPTNTVQRVYDEYHNNNDTDMMKKITDIKKLHDMHNHGQRKLRKYVGVPTALNKVDKLKVQNGGVSKAVLIEIVDDSDDEVDEEMVEGKTGGKVKRMKKMKKKKAKKMKKKKSKKTKPINDRDSWGTLIDKNYVRNGMKIEEEVSSDEDETAVMEKHT